MLFPVLETSPGTALLCFWPPTLRWGETTLFPEGPPMRFHLSRYLCLFLLLACPAFAQQSFAPAPLEPTQLPSRTAFYVIWRGAPSGDVRHANALMSLWDDPDSASLRNSLLQSILTDTKKQKDKPALTREELSDYASLLDNPLVLGYLPRPADQPAPKSTTPGTSAPTWSGVFLVYDRSGKEAILSKAVLRMRSSETDIPKLTNLTVAGVPALKIERKSTITYWTETGKFAVSANELSVFEEVLNRITGKSNAGTLADSPTYQEARPFLSGGILEFFGNISQFTDFALDSAATNLQLRSIVKSLKLDSVHSVAGHLSLEGPRTRVQGAILGDTRTGSLFDLWADGKANPGALAFISASTVSVNESDINFLGIYRVLKQAFTQGPSNSTQLVDSLESAASTRLGMPLPDALALTTGEISSIQNSPTLDESGQIRILGIRNKPDAMKLLRTIMGEKITSERTEGTTTYMKISLGGSQGATGVAQWNFYHLAMTPDFLVGATKNETLRVLLAQPAANSDFLSTKPILAARNQFPEKLNGFSYFDFQKIDWPAMKSKWQAEASSAAAKAKTADEASTSKKLSDWLANVNPEVFPRYLHTMTGASWKDAKGLHFDEWMD